MFSFSLPRPLCLGPSGVGGPGRAPQGSLRWPLPASTRPTVCLSGATTSGPPILECTRSTAIYTSVLIYGLWILMLSVLVNRVFAQPFCILYIEISTISCFEY